MLSETVVSPKTLVPLGVIGTMIPVVFWVAGLSNQISNQAQAAEEMKKHITEIKQSRTTLEIEIMQEIRSSNISANEMERRIAVLDTKMNMLIEMIKNGQQQ